MKAAILTGVALSLISATPVLAATFVNVGDDAKITFDGTIAGLSAELNLELAAVDYNTNIFTFNYTLLNTSPLALHPTSRVRGFAFDDVGVDTNVGSASANGDPNGFNRLAFDTNYPNSIGNVEVCLYRFPGSCDGGGSGATFTDSATGSFSLDYADALDMSSLTLNNWHVRYQSTGLNGAGSGTGNGTEIEIPDPEGGAVPEPSTWAMMLLGFGLIGAAMRRCQSVGTRVRFNFT